MIESGRHLTIAGMWQEGRHMQTKIQMYKYTVYVYKLYRMIAEKNHLSPYLARCMCYTALEQMSLRHNGWLQQRSSVARHPTVCANATDAGARHTWHHKPSPEPGTACSGGSPGGSGSPGGFGSSGSSGAIANSGAEAR